MGDVVAQFTPAQTLPDTDVIAAKREYMAQFEKGTSYESSSLEVTS